MHQARSKSHVRGNTHLKARGQIGPVTLPAPGKLLIAGIFAGVCSSSPVWAIQPLNSKVNTVGALSLAKVENKSLGPNKVLKIKKSPASVPQTEERGEDSEKATKYDTSLISLYRMGLTHTDLRSVGDLIIELRREVTNNPSDAELRMRLGSYLYLTGDYEGAAMEMRRAIALDPNNYVGHTLLAKLLEDAGDEATSQEEYERSIKLAPDFPLARVFYAESLLRRGGISEAINEFRQANEIKPTTAGLAGLADALVIAKDEEGAIVAARQAVSLTPHSATAHISLTKALLLRGDKESALRTARQAALLDPTSAESHMVLGRALYANGRKADAVQEFKQAVSLDPLSAQARNDLGYALYGKGDVASAVTQLQLALRLNPHLSEARNNLEIAIFGLAGQSK